LSRGIDDTEEKQTRTAREAQYILNEWLPLLQNDPAYNPNLSLNSKFYSWSSPPRFIWHRRDVLSQKPYAPDLNIKLNRPSFSELDSRLNPYYKDSNPSRALDVVRNKRSNSFAHILTEGLSIVILNLNRPEYIVPLVNSLKQQEAVFNKYNVGFEVIIGDTGSTDTATLDFYKTSGVKVVRNLKYQFSECNNSVAFNEAKFETILFLNNDIIFPDSSAAIWDIYKNISKNLNIGIAGAVLRFPDGTIQHKGVSFFRSPPEIKGLCYHPDSRCEFDITEKYPVEYIATTGAFLMIKSRIFEEIGGFDVSYKKECQDVALCLESHRRGYKCYVYECGNIIHIENGTRNKGEEEWDDRKRFMRKWKTYIDNVN
jgi:GT2 family glycosyltransferase